tara:strand:- start:6 stop:533 length:528 start_codon:yes stop_codon:yes gene_type:complete
VRTIGLFFLLIFFLSCTHIVPRLPLNKGKQIFLNSSARRNKQMLVNEERLLIKSAKQDSLLSYEKSESGYLFAFKQRATGNVQLPQKGDQIRFQYQIEDLEKNIIYDKEKLGLVNYSIDEEDLLPALREALKIMRPNEVAVFLFPSYLCYSYQGDGDKIGINQPLRFTIERLKNP